MDPETRGQVRTPVGTMWLDAEGLLWHRLDEGVTVRAEHSEPIRRAVVQLTGGKPVRAVVDMSGIRFADRQARDAFARPIDDTSEIATAFIVNSSIARALGTLFLKLSRPSRPVQMFLDERDAVRWVSSVQAAP